MAGEVVGAQTGGCLVVFILLMFSFYFSNLLVNSVMLGLSCWTHVKKLYKGHGKWGQQIPSPLPPTSKPPLSRRRPKNHPAISQKPLTQPPPKKSSANSDDEDELEVKICKPMFAIFSSLPSP